MSYFSILKNLARYCGVSAFSFHFKNEPSIDVVRSMTLQTIRNYNCVINIIQQFSKLATHIELKNQELSIKKLSPSHQSFYNDIVAHQQFSQTMEWSLALVFSNFICENKVNLKFNILASCTQNCFCGFWYKAAPMEITVLFFFYFVHIKS